MSEPSSCFLNDEQIKSAYKALLKVMEKQREGKGESLLEDNEIVQMIITLTHIGDKKRLTPVAVVLPNSLFSIEDGDNALLIVKDPSDTVKELLEKTSVKGVEKVIGLEKLRERTMTFKLRRDIDHDYRKFLCDERIIPMMKSVLGKKVMDKKKNPVSVRLTTTNPDTLEKHINDALASTHVFLNWGSCCNVTVAKSSFSDDQVVANIHAVMETVLKYVKVENIMNISIKIQNSMSIPFYANVEAIRETPKKEKVSKKEKASKKD